MEPKLPNPKVDPLTMEEKQQLLDLLKKLNSNPKVKQLLLEAAKRSIQVDYK